MVGAAPVHESWARTHVPQAAVVFIPIGERYLVGLRTNEAKPGAPVGSIILPGGHVEPGETPEAAAYREVMEETGLSIQDIRPVGRLFVGEGDRCGWMDVQFYTCRRLDERAFSAMRGSEEGSPVVATMQILMATELGLATIPKLPSAPF